MGHKRLLQVLVGCLICMGLTQPAWAATSATLTFSDTGITETQAGSGYKVSGTTLTISAPGVYVVTGSCSEGNVEVKGGLSDVVLIMDDLTLASSQTSPLVVKKGSAVTVHLTGSSTLTDAEDPANETSADTTVADAFEGAAIKVKSGSSVTFCGEGSLTADGSSCKNAIKGAATSALTFNGGSYVVTAANNGIAADGSVTINAGSFDIDAENDGIKAVPDADDADSAGTITINGGSFDIDVDGDGIQADASLTITDGSFDIKTLSGYNTQGTKYNTNNRTSSNNTYDPDTMSCKGLKVSGDRDNDKRELYVTGGSFVLDCADDAVHSDAYATITGGSFDLSSGDDGMHADTSLTLGTKDGAVVRDPDVTVRYSYEGLEGGTVYVYQGRYNVAAKDDGMNAAGGTDSSSGQDGFRPGGRPGRPGSSGTSNASSYNLYVYGGQIYINSDGDGIDSNGGLYLYGGTQTVFGMRAGGDNSALDRDGTLVIDGATIFTAGGTGMDGAVSSTGSSQRCLSVNTSFAANTIVKVSQGGTVLYNDRLPKQSRYTFYSSPSLGSSASITSTSSLLACKSNDWAHGWSDGKVTAEASEETTGLTTYTCIGCGTTETQTIPTTVSLAACDHAVEEQSGGDDTQDEGYAVTFAVGEGASVNVYHTQDYTSASETDVTSTVSRSSDTGNPDSTGDGQVNFTVVVDDGYSFDGLTAANIEGTYKNLKDVSTSELPYTYRITKITSPLTVTVATRADDSGSDPTDLSSAELSSIDAQVWYGEPLEPGVVVTLDGQALEQDSDYELSYANNNAVGTATVTVTGAGDYTGSASAEFAIVYPFTDVSDGTSHLTDVLWLAKMGISTGWGNIPQATFAPNDLVKRGDMAAFLFRLAKLWGVLDASDDWAPTDATAGTFVDVSSSASHAQAIWWLAQNEISTGWSTDAGTVFRPNDPIKRGDVAALIARLAQKAGRGTSVAGDSSAFTDVTSGTAHCDEIWWLAAAGISTGWDTDAGAVFRPNAEVKRGDMAAFLARLDRLDVA